MKVLRFLAVLLLVCSIPFRVFALDTYFIKNDAWFKTNPDAIPVYVEIPSSYGKLEGSLYYYIDCENKCFYLYFGYSESSIDDNGDNIVNLQFEISNDNSSYYFVVNKDSGESIDKSFNLCKDFGEFLSRGQEIFVGIEFLDKAYKNANNTLDITLTVNGNTAYPILENIPLDFGSDEDITTTANQSTTKAKDKEEITTAPNTATEKTDNTPTTKKPTTEPTTKFKYTGSDVSQTTTGKNTETTASNETKQSTATEPTTKFVHTTDTNNSNSEDNVNYDNDNMNAEVISDTTTTQPPTTQKEAEMLIPETQSGNSLSPQAKLLMALAVIFAAFGTAMIFRASAKKEKKEAEEDELEVIDEA